MKSGLVLLVLLVTTAGVAIAVAGTPPVDPPPPLPVPCLGDCVPRSQYDAVQRLATKRLAGWNRANHRILRLQRTWRPTFEYAIALASAVYGVPAWQMRNVASCESTFNPLAKNGIHRGYWQLGWMPFGFSPYDPVAAALSTAQTVRHDGSWRQWVCKP